MNRKEYLTSLTEQIQNRNAKQLVLEEITAHIEDQKEAYLLEGKEEAEAEELAVKEMGDPVDAGTKLNRIHRPKTDVWMLAAMVVLTLIGIVMQSIIFSGYDSPWIAGSFPARTILFNLAGLALMLIVYFADYRIFGKYVWYLYGVYLLAAVVLPHVPPYFEYGHHWQLGQTLNILYIPLFAAFCYYFRGEKGKGILKAIGLLFLNMFLLLLFGYFTSASMILAFFTCLITLCAAAFKGIFGGRKKLQTGLLLASIIGVPAVFLGDVLLFDGHFLFLADYQIRRIQVMLRPAAFAEEAGYQTLLVRDQLSQASLFGGGTIGKVGELSGAWCDYVLICLTAYFGLLAALAVVLIITAYFVRSLHISLIQSNRLGFLLGISCSCILILKTVVYVTMNLGIGLTVSIDMPFLTYGLHCTLINFLFMGIILSVYRNTNLLPEYRKMPTHFRVRFEKVSGK